jgi:hypothetical protein
VASAFGSDNDACVEDYSHAGGFRGLRWLRILLHSSAKSGSRPESWRFLLRALWPTRCTRRCCGAPVRLDEGLPQCINGMETGKWLDLAFKIARRSTPRDRRLCPEAFAGYSRVALCRCAQGKSRTLEALHSHNTHTGRIDFPNSGGLEPARRPFGWCRGPGMDRTSAGSFRVVGRGMSLKRTCLDWISGRLADA